MEPLKTKILVVEDAPEQRLLLVHMLRHAAYEVEFATTGEQAIQMARKIRYELILLDVKLPGMDGFAVCQRLKEDRWTRDVMIICVSGMTKVSEKTRAFELGAVDYITKPYQAQEVLARIRIHLERWRGQQQLKRKNKLLKQEMARRKEAETALRESRAQLRAIWDSATDAMVLSDREGVVLLANQAYYELYRVTPEQVLGNKFNVIFPEAGRAQAMESYKNIFTQDDPPTVYETQINLSDGTQLHVETTVAFLTQETERTALLSIIRDRTEHKRMEEALRRSETLYRSVVQDQTEFIQRYQPDGTIIFANNALCRYWGLSLAELVGETVYKWWPNKAKAQLLQKIAMVTPENPTFVMEVKVIMADKSKRWHNWTNRAIFNEANQLVEFQGVGRDVTNRKQVEEKFRMMEAVVLHTTDGVMITDTDPDPPGPRILFVNEAFTRITGYTLDEIVGKSPRLLQGPNTNRKELKKVRKALLNWQSVRVEVINYRKDGSEFWVDFEVVPVADEKGNYTHWISVQRETTKRKEIEQTLRMANEELHRLATLDGLTQIANRRYFDQHLRREWARGISSQQCITLIFADIDYFKLYNDHYGHLAGDDCLKEVAYIFKQMAKRSRDLVCRYGGEEFAVILPDTNLTGGFKVAQKIREALNELAISHEMSEVDDYLTLSMGVACVLPHPDGSAHHLIDKADKALYKAKAQGRNKIVTS